jgi:MoxR-like ATPase
MLPSDLMEDFTFDDGKAAFHPSALARCMEEGKSIVMDEINLLPFDSLRFLQGIFDGKTEFQYKGHTVHIKEGFKVIGTMNLTVNGVAFGLPEPLVDRCEMIKEFVLNPEMLMGAF